MSVPSTRPTDNCPRLGKVLGTPQPRDAIHVAIASVVVASGQTLRPGQRVGFAPNSTRVVMPPGLYQWKDQPGCPGAFNVSEEHFTVSYAGIIDPYLDRIVKEGEWVWMCLDQGSITSLRHDWTHPAFERRSEAKASP